MSDFLSTACDRCGKYLEYDLPATFWSPPLCEACEAELEAADLTNERFGI